MNIQSIKLVKIMAVSIVLSLSALATSTAYAGCSCGRCGYSEVSTDNYSGVPHYRNTDANDQVDQSAVI